MDCCNSMLRSIGHEIKSLDLLLQRKMFIAATKAGVDKATIMHGFIIGYIYNNSDKEIYQKDLEKEFGIASPTVTNILKHMEKKDYIKRVSVKNDARLKKIVLTEKGYSLHKTMYKKIIENEEIVNNLITDDEKNELLRIIRKLRKGLENS